MQKHFCQNRDMHKHVACMRTMYIIHEASSAAPLQVEKESVARAAALSLPSAIRSSAHVYIINVVLVVYSVALHFKEVLL